MLKDKNSVGSYLRSSSSSNLGLPALGEGATTEGPVTCVGGAEILAGTAPDLSARFLVFMSAVTFFRPAQQQNHLRACHIWL
jgi:hypothetical protein